MRDWVVVGDEAWLREDWERRERRRKWDREYRRQLRTDPEYRARLAAYQREYRRRHKERVKDYQREYMRRRRAGMAVPRASLHDLRCTGPTRSTGCRCRKVIILAKAA